MGLADIMKVSFEFSPKLGIRDLPELDGRHQSSVRGLYIVGDLADAPIIKVALRQGYDVATQLAAELRQSERDPHLLDVAIIGAGPAGIGAALALRDAGLRYAIFEKERPFNTIQNFPKNKHIFSEPRSFENPGNFWFDDAAKEDLVDRWHHALDEEDLVIHQPEEVVDCLKEGAHFTVRTSVGVTGRQEGNAIGGQAHAGAENTYSARRVILAVGRRAAVRRLNCDGEDLPKVAYTLRDPADHTGERVLIVGGGDSAVEAAVAIARAGGQVTISYRKNTFSRAKTKNTSELQALIDDGTVHTALGTTPTRITPHRVVLSDGAELENDRVLIFIGTKLPRAFLKRLGVRMAGEMTALRIAWITGFALLTYLFYVLKSGSTYSEDLGVHVAKKAFFPFGPNDILAQVPNLMSMDLGFRVVDGAFWGTVLYTLLICALGIRAYQKYPSEVQKKRYLSLVAFQVVFLFGVPEILAPLIIDGSPWFFDLFGGDRGWKFYSLSVPWPLNIWALVDAPGWTATGSTAVAIGWIAAGAFVSFVAVPLFVWRYNEKFCSYMCGCGGLAETVGDFWRHLAPRGRTAKQAEWAGRIILVMAVPVTMLILADAWQFLSSGALLNTKQFAQEWYGLVIDFWLASVVGVAFYPYLGNRVWCRFFCPLRAYMEVLAKKFGRLRIVSNDKCIGCGECSRYCQMGIDVQSFAQQQQPFGNAESACIQCGICVQVCPMEVLDLQSTTTMASPSPTAS